MCSSAKIMQRNWCRVAFTMLCKGYIEYCILAANLPIFATHVQTQIVAIDSISTDPSNKQQGAHKTLCGLAPSLPAHSSPDCGLICISFSTHPQPSSLHIREQLNQSKHKRSAHEDTSSAANKSLTKQEKEELKFALSEPANAQRSTKMTITGCHLPYMGMLSFCGMSHTCTW